MDESRIPPNGNGVAIRLLWTLFGLASVIILSLLGTWGWTVERRLEAMSDRHVDILIRLRILEAERMRGDPPP